MKEKLAIISSYDDFCGNASYTKALREGLARHYDVTVISLNVRLLRNESRKRIQQYLKQICEQLQSYDCVNIQFEEGLFGSSFSSIKYSFFTIAKACKKLVLTMHRVHGKMKYPNFALLGKSLLKFKLKPYVKSFLQTYATNRHVPLYNSIIKFCKRRQIPIIVHTLRSKEFIQEKFSYQNVFDHPLSFYDQTYIESIISSYSREDFCEEYALDINNIYIGIFGFINSYKGHETAIKSLLNLPEHYKLLIFGAQHPLTIQLGEKIQGYIKDLIQLISSLGLSNRVEFHRIGNDDEFLRALLRCDYNVLPYLEVNQGGSGIAALSLETCSNALFAQTNAFLELEKYAPNAFKLFSIGNYRELASAILSYRKQRFTPFLKNYHQKYNLTTNVNLYQKLLSCPFLASL